MWNISTYFDKHDLWLGVYWKTQEMRRSTFMHKGNGIVQVSTSITIYVCLLPTWVIQLSKQTHTTEEIPCPFQAA